ncbi:MAG: hypothetical protein ACXADY_18250 [Candidatus Hodarchaeales archaeon]|jgi:hypothetical protein
MITDIRVNYKDAFQTFVPTEVDVVNSFKVPDDGHVYWQVTHDYENELWGEPRPKVLGYKPSAPPEERSLPEMYNLKGVSSGEFTPMSPLYQQLWFDLLDKASGFAHSVEEILQVWKDVTAQARALTDRHSREYGFADYILGENLNGKPMAIKYLTCGGNLLRQKRRDGTRIYVEAINTSEPAPDVNELWGKWWLIQWATESTVFRLPDKTWQVSRWHWNFTNDKKYGTPFPLLSENGEFRIDRGLLKSVNPGEIISPYNPSEA